MLSRNEAVMMLKANTYKGLTMPTARGRVPVPFDEVIFMESSGKTVMIYTLKNGVLHTYKTLNELEVLLPPELFGRIHRSFIIAYQYITCIHPHTVSLNGQHHIPIGRVYAAVLRARYIHL